MKRKYRLISVLTAAVLACTGTVTISTLSPMQADAATESIESAMDWGTVRIGGGGFVSGIVTGQSEMYARTDVGGAYRYDYDTEEWVQLLGDLNESQRGYLSVDAMCIDPTDDQTIYLLCGCAYFSDAKTAIFRSHDGGETFDIIDVTDLIQVHGNGYGRQFGEAIAVDPDNPDIIYCGGDVTAGSSALIMSEDGGDTWVPVEGYDDLGMYTNTINWPTWTSHSVRALTADEYNTQNGVGSIAIENGKVSVATSIAGVTNVHMADIGAGSAFEPVSDALPANYYPSRINVDADGNLLISYVAGIVFDGSAGGAYKYNTTTGEVTDISPTGNGFGAVYSDPDDANRLIATTCGLWYSQLWYENAWEDENVCWGDRFFKSEDGGATWTSMTPGNQIGWGQPLEAEYLQSGGFDWIENKAIHWAGAIVLDPRDDNRLFVTSGNGVFACDNTWDTTPAFYFHPNGIEEVVALDMTSVPGGAAYSAIGDYDGFAHTDVNVPGEQYQPNMGSTGAIAYCPQNPDVMIRIAENQNDTAPGFYTLDGGETWTKMANTPGGKAAITQLVDGSYRFFKSSSDNSTAVVYSDDYGQTWSDVGGIATAYGSKPTYLLVEPDQPNIVYAYVTYYNSSWGYSKPAAEFSDAHYTLYVSTDYGQTFTGTDVAMYDQCDSAGRIAYLSEGTLALAAGWYGAYIASDYGKTITKLDSVYYCKTMGYGAPEHKGDPNTLYMYGQPTESDPEGIYRSTDSGESWVLINQHNLYGGTGNGNFLVGDMNEFGTVYMSTVGCGIVVGKLTDADAPSKPVTTTTTALITTTDASTTTTEQDTTAGTTSTDDSAETTTETTVVSKPDDTTTSPADTTTTDIATTEPDTTSATDNTTSSSVQEPDFNSLCGDVTLDMTINMSDTVLLNKRAVNLVDLTEAGEANADCNKDGVVDGEDAMILLRFCVQLIDHLPYTE